MVRTEAKPLEDVMSAPGFPVTETMNEQLFPSLFGKEIKLAFLDRFNRIKSAGIACALALTLAMSATFMSGIPTAAYGDSSTRPVADIMKVSHKKVIGNVTVRSEDGIEYIEDATTPLSSAPSIEAAADQGRYMAIEAAEEPQTASAEGLVKAAEFAGLIDNSTARQRTVATLLDKAQSLEGVPYVYGGTTPSGFDCSGFVQYCFREALGIEMPRSAAAQSGVGRSVSMDELEAGDLLFWGSKSGVYHVAIYLADGVYIHAPKPGKNVMEQYISVNTPTFAMRVI